MLRKILTIAFAGTTLALAGCDVLDSGSEVPAATSTPSPSPSSTPSPSPSSPPAPAGTGIAQWARTPSPGPGSNEFSTVVKDDSGNVYAAGYFVGTGSFVFGTGVAVTGVSSGWNAVLVKYNASGTAQWAKAVSTGFSDSRFFSVATDSSGNVYVVGYIFDTGNYNFGDGVTAAGPSSTYNLVLVKYNASGTAQWAKTVSSGSEETSFNGVTVDGSGNVYAAGYIGGQVTYDFGNSVTATGVIPAYNAVLVKYNSSGTAQWAKTVTAAPESSQFVSVTTDSSGNVYAAGWVYETGAYGFGDSVTAAGASSDTNLVLVKYNASGTAQWAKTVSSGSSANYFYGVTTDGSGNVYAAGFIAGTGSFGFGNSVSAAGANSGNNVLLVKYNASGTAQWAKTMSSGSSNSCFYGVTTDSSGNVYAAGFINDTGTYDFGNSVTAAGAYSGSNVLLVKFNASGTAQWAKTLSSGSNQSTFKGVTTDGSGHPYAVGYFYGMNTFGFGNSVTAAGANGSTNSVLVNYE